jgi:hypothetical protein
VYQTITLMAGVDCTKTQTISYYPHVTSFQQLISIAMTVRAARRLSTLSRTLLGGGSKRSPACTMTMATKVSASDAEDQRKPVCLVLGAGVSIRDSSIA